MAGSRGVEIVELSLGDGSVVHAEVIALDAGPAERRGGGDAGLRRTAGQVGQAVALQLDEVRSLVRGVGRWAAETVEGQPWNPDQFEVAFGLKLAAKSGHLVGIIAEAGGEASLTVRMTWDLAARREHGGPPQVEITAVAGAEDDGDDDGPA